MSDKMSPTESGKCPVRQIRERWQVKKSWAKAQERGCIRKWWTPVSCACWVKLLQNEPNLPITRQEITLTGGGHGNGKRSGKSKRRGVGRATGAASGDENPHRTCAGCSGEHLRRLDKG